MLKAWGGRKGFPVAFRGGRIQWWMEKLRRRQCIWVSLRGARERVLNVLCDQAQPPYGLSSPHTLLPYFPLHVQFYTYIYTQFYTNWVISFMWILLRSTFFYILSFSNLSDSLPHTHHIPPTPITLLCLLVSNCFESSHNILHVHIVIYIHKYMCVLYRCHNYKNGSYYIPLPTFAFLTKNIS